MVFERSFEALKNLTKEPYKNVRVMAVGAKKWSKVKKVKIK